MTPEEALLVVHHSRQRAEELTHNGPLAGQRYGASVARTLEDISDTIQRTQRVTEAQERALTNLSRGVEKWFPSGAQNPN